MIKLIEHPCKICGRPAIAKFDDDAIQEAVDKFLPMLSHDHCVDLRVKRNKSGQAILDACAMYATAKEPGKIVRQIRQTLLEATRKYAEAMQEILGAPHIIWTEEFADTLLEHPQSSIVILRAYRDEVRRSVRQPAAAAA